MPTQVPIVLVDSDAESRRRLVNECANHPRQPAEHALSPTPPHHPIQSSNAPASQSSTTTPDAHGTKQSAVRTQPANCRRRTLPIVLRNLQKRGGMGFWNRVLYGYLILMTIVSAICIVSPQAGGTVMFMMHCISAFGFVLLAHLLSISTGTFTWGIGILLSTIFQLLLVVFGCIYYSHTNMNRAARTRSRAREKHLRSGLCLQQLPKNLKCAEMIDRAGSWAIGVLSVGLLAAYLIWNWVPIPANFYYGSFGGFS